jgi:1-deoxy-D-xylulose-5-phosphate reductoisomerase
MGNEGNAVKKILLTASGGPFRGYTKEQLKSVTVADALIHPNWNMGRKITIDSATMINKALEIIEAKWLYEVEAGRIEVIVHPQSIIHSLVEFDDGALLAQLGVSSMKVPISYAFSYPERWATDARGLDLVGLGSLSFEEPAGEGRRSLDMAYRVLRESEEHGWDSGAVALNGANEVLVEQFLEGKIVFTDVVNRIERVLDAHKPQKVGTIADILHINEQARQAALDLCR